MLLSREFFYYLKSNHLLRKKRTSNLKPPSILKREVSFERKKKKEYDTKVKIHKCTFDNHQIYSTQLSATSITSVLGGEDSHTPMSAVTYHLVAGEGNVDFAEAVAFKEKYALSKSGGPLCAHGVMTVVTSRLFLVFHEVKIKNKIKKAETGESRPNKKK